MKGSFTKNDTNITLLEDTLKKHEPYAVLAVSTTGLNNKDFNEHCPTRVVLEEYEYNAELQNYVKNPALSMDMQVMASQEAIAIAEAGLEKYDVFKGAGIELEDYKTGKGVASQEEFAQAFISHTKALSDENAVLIINGGLSFAKPYLNQLGELSTALDEMNLKGLVVNQTDLTQEYFDKKGIEGKAKLEDLRNAITASPPTSFVKQLEADENLMKDFKEKSKEDFLKEHSEFSSRAYGVTEKDLAKREAKIEGTDNRTQMIDQFVHTYAREIGVIPSQWVSNQIEHTQEVYEQMSASGKEKYANNGVNEKLNTLIESGVIDPQKIADGNSEYDKLLEALNSPNNKGIIIMHAASTGFDRLPPPKNTGEPIQFTAVAVQRGEDGTIDFSDLSKNAVGVSMNIACSRKAFLNAEHNASSEAKKPYNTFEKTGISIDDYKQRMTELGILGEATASRQNPEFKMKTRKEAQDTVKSFFDKFPPDDYVIIAAGGTRGSDNSFAQTCMSNLVNLSAFQADYVDFAQAIKDYTYHTVTEGIDNVVVDVDNMEGKSFSLESLASMNNEDINSTNGKCSFMTKMIGKMAHQYELEHQPLSNEQELQAEGIEFANEPVGEVEHQGTSFIDLDTSTEFDEMEMDEIVEDYDIDEIEDVIYEQEHEKAEPQPAPTPVIVQPTQSGGRSFEPKTITESNAEHNEPTTQAVAPRQFRGGSRRSLRSDLVGERSGEIGLSSENIPAPPPRRFGGNREGTFISPDTRPVPPPPPPPPAQSNNQIDVNKLIETITAQNTLIASMSAENSRQSEIIADMATKVIKLLEDNNKMVTMLIEKEQASKEPHKEAPSIEAENGVENVVNYLENIKEQIAEVSEQLPSKASKALSQANEAISDGQKELTNDKQKSVKQHG